MWWFGGGVRVGGTSGLGLDVGVSTWTIMAYNDRNWTVQRSDLHFAVWHDLP
jgi:hypothetical protein